MKLLILLVFLTVVGISHCQEHKYLFDKEIIERNKVSKVLEYSLNDSVGFFNDYPNGFYSKFDKYGRLIESNHYSGPADSNLPSLEFRNYYLYDSLNNQVGFIQLHDGWENPFRFIELKSFNPDDSLVQKASLSSGFVVNSSIEFVEESLNDKDYSENDTLDISKYHKRIYFKEDSSFYMDFHYNEANQIDSTVVMTMSYRNGELKYPTSIITIIEYFDNGYVKTKTKRHFNLEEEKKLTSESKFIYFESGLLDKIITSNPSTDKRNVSKFIYYYFE